MKTISCDYYHELVIKNSKFLTFLFQVNTISLVDMYLDKVKSLHPKATHYCYGYIIGDIKRQSDDGEPTGTAGSPILSVLEKEGLSNILVIVVRYFGGIKLGAGGLIRAYTKSVGEALNGCSFIELVKGFKVRIVFPYSLEKQVRYLLDKSPILESSFQENISFVVLIDETHLLRFSNYDYEILEELYIEKAS